MRIPEFIGSLTNLTTLHLSVSGFYGKIPPHLGNLTSLNTLSLHDTPGLLHSDNLQWLSRLSSMEDLDLSEVDLSNATDWVSTLKLLPNLSRFYCSSCSLPYLPPLVSSTCPLNHSIFLQALDLSYNHISSYDLLCLINGDNNLTNLYIDSIHPEQNPDEFFRPLFQIAPTLVSLTSLGISRNQLSDFMLAHNSSGMPKLETLDISYNLMTAIPDLSTFSSLLDLDASFNRINGSLYANLNHLPQNLANLDLSANSLSDVVTDAHLSNLPMLLDLSLSGNYHLTFNFSKRWTPPSQLGLLQLSSCKLGPKFPNWLLRLDLEMLDISNSSIVDFVPNELWTTNSLILHLNVSNNKLRGILPNLSFEFQNFPIMDLSSNEFYGPIPAFMFFTGKLDLSNNQFSSLPLILNEASNLQTWKINLSNNRLLGTLPHWIFQISGLEVLNLAYNRLSGEVPNNIGSLGELNALHLNSNRLFGELPSSMQSCGKLKILELAYNNFSESVPFWLGDNLFSLVVLNLRSNNISGDFPPNLCQLQSLQVLDLSGNKISGSIPDCVHNFTSMATYESFSISSYIDQSSIANFGPMDNVDYASIMWKGILANESSTNLPQWNIIDLSNNRLTGEIPSGFTFLKYLRSLDLSSNNLNESIPAKIGQLRSLEVLRLSSNKLGGEIPESLASLTFLNTLNLSCNNLIGRIPKSTQLQSFDPSAYGGNAELCGEPLLKKCPGDLDQPPTFVIDHDHTGDKHNDKFDMEAFYAALGSGFAFGLLGALGILNFHAPSRYAFFHMASEFEDWIFVRTFLCRSRIRLFSSIFICRKKKMESL